MDTRQHNSANDVNSGNIEPLRSDFEGWDIRMAAEPWWNHPLIIKGGSMAIATTAIVMLSSIAKQCLAEKTLSDIARITGMLGLGVLIVAIVLIARWFIRFKNG